ncbi:hypothetical protein H5410_060296 [Solanum commersonii]|uniref:Uncharacterized protein n=1 Tax=Solanum commersonii TaxID=4109 RepID=A0A9J5W4U6_SOLCO|nr:hypothetical protein H5410_060296 [Solanum commersonii]
MGEKNVFMLQEEGGTSKISTSEGRNQENIKINDLIPMPNFIEKQDDIINISSKREQENHKTNDMILISNKLCYKFLFWRN